jgi:hypothetical protein
MSQARLWIAALTLAAAAAPAAAKPDFTGSWAMNAANSDFGPMPAPSVFTRVVKHQEPTLEVSTTQAGPQGTVTTHLTYTTDGSESINHINGTEVRSVCRWDGDTLVISYDRHIGSSVISVEERWSLSEDGNVTTIHSNVKGSMGEFQMRLVLDRQ